MMVQYFFAFDNFFSLLLTNNISATMSQGQMKQKSTKSFFFHWNEMNAKILPKKFDSHSSSFPKKNNKVFIFDNLYLFFYIVTIFNFFCFVLWTSDAKWGTGATFDWTFFDNWNWRKELRRVWKVVMFNSDLVRRGSSNCRRLN